MKHRPLLIAIPLVLILVGIFLLAQQGTDGTRRIAGRVEHMLMRIIPPTGTGSIGEPTWFGLTIRRLAHVVEYAALGLAASVVTCSLWGATLQAAIGALCLCCIASIADEAHKTLVPGRHFETSDLALDAIGYVFAVVICLAIAGLLTR